MAFYTSIMFMLDHLQCVKIVDIYYNILNIQGVPKKTHDIGFLAITLLWKGLGRKEGCVLKNSGNSLSDRHQNFSI